MKTKKVSFDERCLISTDLDGTLLNNKGKLTPYTKAVIKKLNDLGHIICINTARPFNACKDIYKELGLKTPIVTHNGALMFNPYDSDFPSTNWSISPEVVKELLADKNVRKNAVNVVIDAESKNYVYARYGYSDEEWRQIFAKFGIMTTNPIIQLNQTTRWYNDKAYTLLFAPRSEATLMDLINAIKTKVPTLLTKIWRCADRETIIEVRSPNCSKAVAVDGLSNYYGIPNYRTFSFGDGIDDAEMLKFAAICGFAMKNGTNEAQMLASYVTEWTNDDDGVARTLNKIFKLGIKR